MPMLILLSGDVWSTKDKGSFHQCSWEINSLHRPAWEIKRQRSVFVFLFRHIAIRAGNWEMEMECWLEKINEEY
ncbi:hypothetical protein LOK49_LG02G00804 [Camellia lanceoleosa]|uniref:Uncharacterized protein n=1 Tax=Camellia lanceoleosa TaxID=1840588 RepID=A0ACC0ITB3_9ERIC|nr:hypothetical protein LOK49_LG02G00804 [Camellia lanceoleosa]